MKQKEKIHSTNYYNTLIEVAEDCPVLHVEVPQSKADKKTIAAMQFEIIAPHPYQFTSDDVLFQVYADRNNLPQTEYEAARKQFFSKGQPCFRASPLPKKMGFGIHSNSEGKIAIVGIETDEYQKLLNDPSVTKVKAMRTARK